MIRFGSVCSGIEAAAVAWEPLGWQCAFLAETAAFPRAVLAHHFPSTPLFGDFTKMEGDHGSIDVLVAGTPCQSFSRAGNRLGINDPRGNLALEYLRLAYRLRPAWFVWENVPGLLSSDGGRDFGTFLAAATGQPAGSWYSPPDGAWQSGGVVAPASADHYGLAWRVLDAQFVRTPRFPGAVPQRRKRVFVVGYLGDWRRAAEVLIEPESMRGDPPPRRTTGEDTARGVAPRLVGGGRGTERTDAPRGQDAVVAAVAPTLPAMSRGGGGVGGTDHDLDGGLVVGPALAISGRATREGKEDLLHGWGINEEVAFGVNCHTPRQAVAVAPVAGALTQRYYKGPSSTVDDSLVPLTFEPRKFTRGFGPTPSTEVTSTLQAEFSGSSDKAPHVVTNGTAAKIAVRRLTPVEAERLMGFEDGYTAIPWRGRAAADCPDGPRYRALGNSMAVNCMDWIGRRIQETEK